VLDGAFLGDSRLGMLRSTGFTGQDLRQQGAVVWLQKVATSDDQGVRATA